MKTWYYCKRFKMWNHLQQSRSHLIKQVSFKTRTKVALKNVSRGCHMLNKFQNKKSTKKYWKLLQKFCKKWPYMTFEVKPKRIQNWGFIIFAFIQNFDKIKKTYLRKSLFLNKRVNMWPLMTSKVIYRNFFIIECASKIK